MLMIQKLILKNKKIEAIALKSTSGGFRGREAGRLRSFLVLKSLWPWAGDLIW